MDPETLKVVGGWETLKPCKKWVGKPSNPKRSGWVGKPSIPKRSGWVGTPESLNP